MRLRRLYLSAALGVAAFAQSAADLPDFEAVSIKVSKAADNGSDSDDSPGQWVARNVTLRSLIRRAYQLKDHQIAGPAWINSERYDITAKIPKHEGPSQIDLRIRRLLIERFKLETHREQKEFPVYALLPAKTGLKIKAVDDVGDHKSNSTRGRYVGEHVSMARIAEFLARYMDRPVVDFTNDPHVFNVTLQWIPDEALKGPDPPSGLDLLSAIQEQLGLRLQPQKALIDLIVVDRAEKVPVEN